MSFQYVLIMLINAHTRELINVSYVKQHCMQLLNRVALPDVNGRSAAFHFHYHYPNSNEILQYL